MNICLVTTSFPRHPGDYAGSFVGDRVRELLAAGHTVEVLAAGDGGATREMAHERLTITRIRSPHPALFYGDGAPEALERGGLAVWLAGARFSVELTAAIRARAARFDLVESHWLVPSALATLAAAPDRPQRAFAHSGDVALLERVPLGRAIARRFVGAGVDLRFVSDDLRARFAALAGAPRPVGEVEALRLPAGDWLPRDRADAVTRRQLGLTGPTVLAIGRLVPIKGHDRLLRACGRVLATGAIEALEVVILGDGPERARLARLAGELGLRLRLPGFVPRAEVARWLRAADIYVQPSIRLANGRGEGAPMATAEARAIGIPVVVESDVGNLAAELSRTWLQARDRRVTRYAHSRPAA
jgi:glycosyltransferase involved in cell wall biosynthesis